MTRASDYDYWEHVSGFRVNPNQRIKYENEAAGLTLFIEGDVNESGDENEVEYRVWLQDENRENVIYPDPFPSKDAAFTRLEELMEEYDQPDY